ncbi:adenylate/guanylate cyclase domain-containing protein [Hoeflea sp. TYP-13]|uniref:adenylate/guanylate cyclase domain-containing protein n=1 Tax=Hoeflea sp. TYP-13 TaxID=3230023 RepID=UPI0034C6D69A
MKSIFALILICVIFMDLEYVLFRDRSVVELTTDAWIFAACVTALVIMHLTRRMDVSYVVFACMMIPVFMFELWIAGNKHGALYTFAIFSIWTIAAVGPKASIPMFIVCVAVVIISVAIEPYLPRMRTEFAMTASNPEGWLFHNPQKEPIGRDEALTFLFGLSILYAGMYSAQSALNQANRRIEHLLVNVLPPSIAARLTERDEHDFLDGGATIADAHDEATILFADIVGFTEISSKIPPDEVVALLDRIFGTFDDLAELYEVEKIKTIGDAYMAVCGLPEPNTHHAVNIMEMAIAMLDAVSRIRTESGSQIHLRIGINTGPVVAGIIGRRRFLYDLWGDAVNTASRMESHGEADTIQVGRNTYEALKDAYEFRALGNIKVKGKGLLPAWQLIGRRRIAPLEGGDAAAI